MRVITAVLASGLLAVVLAFQACTPLNPKATSSPPGSPVNRSTSSDNNALPFDGKTVTMFQNRDAEFCSKAGSEQLVRNEIVRDQLGYWMTVQECKTIPAKNIENGQSDSEGKNIYHDGKVLEATEIKNPTEFTRVKCFDHRTGVHTVTVYESPDGLTMDYPSFRANGNPEFLPITATHALGERKHVTGFTYKSSYHSSFWNQHYRGTFNFYLREDGPGNRIGNWYMDFKGARTNVGGAGPCEVAVSKYPW